MLPSLLKIRPLDNHYPPLHGLRSLAVLGVVQIHVAYEIGEHFAMSLPHKFIGVFNSWFVMDLFFIMSGYLIGNILLRSLGPKAEVHWRSIWRFYLRRGFRTFPLYYCFLFLYFLISRHLDILPPPSQAIKAIDFHELVYLTNYPIDWDKYLVYWSWSLSVEEHFYLAAPLIVILLNRLRSHRARIVTLLLLWASGLLVRLAVLRSLDLRPGCFSLTRSLYTPTHCRYDIFFMGILMAYLHTNFKAQIAEILANQRNRCMFAALAGGVFLIILSPQINPYPQDFQSTDPRVNWWIGLSQALYFGTLTGVGYFFLIQLALGTHSWWTRLLAHRGFLYLATLGYGIYLVHIPVAHFVVRTISQIPAISEGHGKIMRMWLVSSSVSFILSGVVAYLMHLGIEKPFLWLRDRVAR